MIPVFLKTTLLLTICMITTVSAAENEASLFLAGDTLLGRAMNRKSADKTIAIFKGVLPFMKGSDLAFVNLECVISDQGHPIKKTEHRPYFYRAHPGMLRFLSEAGIDIVLQANNHANDYGTKALEQNIALLENAGITPTGIGTNTQQAALPAIMCINGLSIGWVAFDAEEPFPFLEKDRLGINYIPEKDILNTIGPIIDRLRSRTDIIIVTPHWGLNWKTSPTKERQRIAHALIDRGADMIAGTSSHIFHGIEIYNKKPIIYDMGSFLFDSIADQRLRESFFIIVHATRQGISKLEAYPIRLEWGAVDLEKPSRAPQRVAALLKTSMLIDPSIHQWVSSPISNILTLDLHPNPLPSHATRQPCTMPRTATSLPIASPPVCLLPTSEIKSPQAQPILLRPGIEYLGGKAPLTLKQGHSFLVKTYFRAVGSKSRDRWLIDIWLNSPDGMAIHDGYPHDAGDWSYPTNTWRENNIVLDEYMFRPPKNIKPGTYDLFMSLISFDKKTRTTQAPIKTKVSSIEIK